jgi:hypothetical protein
VQITATLTRFHKIEERFKLKRTELKVKLQQLTRPTSITLTKGMVEPTLNNGETSEEAIELLEEIEQMSAVVCNIRTAIAVKNVELGISAMLSEYNEQVQLKQIATQVRATNLKGYTDTEDCFSVLGSLATQEEAQQINVDINGLHKSYVNKVEEIIEGYEARINELSDLISDRNKEKLTLEIPEKFKILIGSTK